MSIQTYSLLRNPSEQVTRVRYDQSTSNLVQHMNICEPKQVPVSHTMATFAYGSTYNPDRFHLNLVLWVAQHHCPFILVNDPEFIQLLQSLNNKISIPSRSTLSCDIKEVFQMSWKTVAIMLQVSAYNHLSGTSFLLL
jgi:hypothetical protein